MVVILGHINKKTKCIQFSGTPYSSYVLCLQSESDAILTIVFKFSKVLCCVCNLQTFFTGQEIMEPFCWVGHLYYYLPFILLFTRQFNKLNKHIDVDPWWPITAHSDVPQWKWWGKTMRLPETVVEALPVFQFIGFGGKITYVLLFWYDIFISWKLICEALQLLYIPFYH